MRLFCDVSQRIADPWLRRAFILAESGRGTTSPNPLVGCVIERDGKVVGEGFHARAGMPHAEVVALDSAGDGARGATAHVTLEPCTHHGRTAPCTDALISAGVARVVIGMRDPNVSVSGRGVEVLRSAGIRVTVVGDPSPFEAQNEAWLASLETGRPFVRVKLGLSLDGHSALRAGERASVTGASGAEVTRSLRTASDAVLVGAATVACDDPALTVRTADGGLYERQPLRVVLARESAPPATARLFTDGIARTLLLAPAGAAEEVCRDLPPTVEVVEYDSAGGIDAALRALLEAGIVDVLVEPGPRLFTAIWRAGLIDELIVVSAGGMAGPDAPPSFLENATRQPGEPSELAHVMAAVEAGVVGDVAVNVWRPHARHGQVEAIKDRPGAEQSNRTFIGRTRR